VADEHLPGIACALDHADPMGVAGSGGWRTQGEFRPPASVPGRRSTPPTGRRPRPVARDLHRRV